MNLRLQRIIDYYIGTLLHVLLKPFVILAGKILRRDHDLTKCETVTVIKMLGGGSLTIAYPALVAIKETRNVKHLRLLTTPEVKPFGEALGIFDEITVVRVNSLKHLVGDSISAMRKLFGCDVIVDLEIYSRLTTVLALVTCARNRVGFYTLDSFWRKYLSTHLLFCNTKRGIYHFYDQIAALFGGTVEPFAVYQQRFRDSLGVAVHQPGSEAVWKIAIAPCASDLSKERMLQLEEWIEVVLRRLMQVPHGKSVVVALYGAPGDRPLLDRLCVAFEQAFPGISTMNRAGQTVLLESVREIAAMDELVCIDSALLHYGRLLGLPLTSYWGPTEPASLLRPRTDGPEETHYFKLPCSPCVHLTHVPPCRGNNICMRLAVHPELPLNINPAWIVTDQEATRFTPQNEP